MNLWSVESPTLLHLTLKRQLLQCVAMLGIKAEKIDPAFSRNWIHVLLAQNDNAKILQMFDRQVIKRKVQTYQESIVLKCYKERIICRRFPCRNDCRS